MFDLVLIGVVIGAALSLTFIGGLLALKFIIFIVALSIAFLDRFRLVGLDHLKYFVDAFLCVAHFLGARRL